MYPCKARTSRKPNFISRLRRLGNDQAGAAAVEFSIVAIPFLFLVCVAIELALILIMRSCLSSALAVAAQEVRVGTVIATGVSNTTSSGSDLDVADFEQLICNNIFLVSTTTCAQQIQVDVRTLSSYNSSSSLNPFSGQTFNANGLCFYSGQAGAIVEVTAYYFWPVPSIPLISMLSTTTSITSGSGTTSGAWFALTSTEIFKSEPDPNIINSGTGC